MTMLFKVNFSKEVEVTREEEPGEEYSGESTITHYSDLSMTPVNDNSFDVSGNFNETDVVDNVFLVYATYDTGDSLSSHDGAGIEFVESFLTREKALELVDTAKIQNKIYYRFDQNSLGKASVDYFNRLESIGVIAQLEAKVQESGKVFNLKKFKETLDNRLYFRDEVGEVKFLATPWSGYFENLNEIRVDEFPVMDIVQIKKKKLM